MDISGQPAEAHKKIYNPKSNRMIAINGPVYRKLLLGGYMHWREGRGSICSLQLDNIKNPNYYYFFSLILSTHKFQIYVKHPG